MPKYELIIWWSDEDDCFVVDVPELPGCMADGETYVDAARNAEGAIAAWLTIATEKGYAIPEPRGRLIPA